MNEQALMDVLDRLHNRFYGKYRGTVTEVDAATLRIKAKLQGALSGRTTGWCAPCVPYAGDGVGIAFLPEVDAGVWIEFEGGDTSLPIWTGCFWFDGQAPSDAAPSVKVIATKAGKVVFDNDAGTITVSDGNNNTVTLGSDGITLQRGGSSVAVSDSEVNVNDGAFEVLGG
jgi:phage baseplate assembly protein gpV